MAIYRVSFIFYYEVNAMNESSALKKANKEMADKMGFFEADDIKIDELK
jgi:hypothetical protein